MERGHAQVSRHWEIHSSSAFLCCHWPPPVLESWFCLLLEWAWAQRSFCYGTSGRSMPAHLPYWKQEITAPSIWHYLNIFIKRNIFFTTFLLLNYVQKTFKNKKILPDIQANEIEQREQVIPSNKHANISHCNILSEVKVRLGYFIVVHSVHDLWEIQNENLVRQFTMYLNGSNYRCGESAVVVAAQHDGEHQNKSAKQTWITDQVRWEQNLTTFLESPCTGQQCLHNILLRFSLALK